MTHKDIVERGRRVLRMETEALSEAERRIVDDFARAVECIQRSEGRVIVSRRREIRPRRPEDRGYAHLDGNPATFLHPADSVHGDSRNRGQVRRGHSHLQERRIRRGAWPSRPFEAARCKYNCAHEQCEIDPGPPQRRYTRWVGQEEACPHDLAPTTSTTVALALGDALAIALLEEKGFDADDFARLHPGGAIGRRLLTRVSDVMVTENLPILTGSATMREAVVQLAERRGIAIVTAGDERSPASSPPAIFRASWSTRRMSSPSL